MAIKEFIIAPQNYFEPEYFLGDYTESNQSRSTLICDADRIVGFEFQAGFFFEEGFIEEGAFGVNSIIATMQVEAMIVQVAEISAGSYYEQGYYAAGYYENRGSFFTLTAELERKGELVEAFGDLFVQTTIAVTAQKIVDDPVALAAEFTQTATISHIQGSDMFAFGEAQLAVTVDRIRDNNIEVSTAFSTAADVGNIKQFESDSDTAFATETDAQRSRDHASEMATAFSLAAEVGSIKQFESDNDTAFTTETDAQRSRDHASEMATAFSLAAEVGNIKQFESDNDTAFTTETDAERRPGIIQNISSAFSFGATTTKFTGIVANLAATATVSCRIKLGITWINANGQQTPTSFLLGVSGAVIDNTTFNFGSGSLSIPSNQSDGIRRGIIASQNARLHSIPAGQTTYSISFWFRRSAGIVQSRILHLGEFASTDNFWQMELASGYMVINQRTNGINYVATSQGQFNLTQNVWHFIEFSAVAFSARRVYKLFVNGTEYGFFYGPTSDVWPMIGIPVPNRGAFISGNNNGGIFIDDYQFRVGSSLNGTVPTQRSTPVAATRTLLPFDSNFDDIAGALTITAQAALFSLSTVNANVESFRFVSAAATLESEFVLAATGDKLKLASADLISESTVTADITIDYSGVLTVDSEFTQTVDANIFRDSVSGLESAAEVTAIISHIHGADIVASGFAQLTTDGDLVADISEQITAAFDLNVDADRARVLDSDLSSEFAITTEITAIFTADSAVTSEFNSEIDGDRLRFATGEFNGIVDLVSDAVKTTLSVVAADSISDLALQPLRIQQGVIVTESVASNLTIAVKIGSVVVDMPVISEVTADLTGTLNLISALSSEFELIGSGTGRAQAEADLFAESIHATEVKVSREFHAVLSSEFGTAAFAIIASELVLHIDTEFNLAVDIAKFVGIGADLDAVSVTVIDNERIRENDCDTDSEFAQHSQAVKTTDIIQQLTSNFATTATISNIRGIDIVVDSFASINVNADLIKSADIDLAAQINVHADVQVLVGLEAAVSSEFTQTAESTILLAFDIAANSQSSLTANVGYLATASADLTAFNSVLSLGRLVNLDMKIFTIPPETRIHTITSETRVHRIRR